MKNLIIFSFNYLYILRSAVNVDIKQLSSTKLQTIDDPLGILRIAMAPDYPSEYDTNQVKSISFLLLLRPPVEIMFSISICEGIARIRFLDMFCVSDNVLHSDV